VRESERDGEFKRIKTKEKKRGRARGNEAF
jgi:hypothetical protein